MPTARQSIWGHASFAVARFKALKACLFYFCPIGECLQLIFPYQVGGVVGPGSLKTHFQAEHMLNGFWWQLCAAPALRVGTHPNIHPHVHSFHLSFSHAFVLSFNQSFIQSRIHSCIHSVTHSFKHSFSHAFIQSVTLSCIHPCIIHLIACCTLKHYTSDTTTVLFAVDGDHLTPLLLSQSSVALCCCTRVSRKILIRATFSPRSFKSSNVLTSSANECSTL